MEKWAHCASSKPIKPDSFSKTANGLGFTRSKVGCSARAPASKLHSLAVAFDK